MLLIPFGLLFAGRLIQRLDGLSRLRAVYLRLLIIPFFFLLVLYLITDDGEANPGWIPWGVGGIGLACIAGVLWVRHRRLDTSSSQRLAGSYSGSFFIGIGVAQVAILYGFVGVFVAGKFWIYLLGMALGLAALALVGPTRRELARRQEQIAAQGSSLSLVRALKESSSQRPKA